MNVADHPIRIQARHPHFDFDSTPIQWIPGDPASTHLINTLNLLFPESERWFCRVFKKALPLIEAPTLKADAAGFVAQEATHAHEHGRVLSHYYEKHRIAVQPFSNRLGRLFNALLGDRPLGVSAGTSRFWLRQQLAVIAAFEHFFNYLGNWVLTAHALEEAHADPTMLALLRWHGAEEVEHRAVAFDVYCHLGGRYVERIFHMTLVMSLFLYVVATGARFMYRQDPGAGRYPGFVRAWSHGSRRGHLPSFWRMTAAALRYYRPGYQPHKNVSTQALAYLARLQDERQK